MVIALQKTATLQILCEKHGPCVLVLIGDKAASAGYVSLIIAYRLFLLMFLTRKESKEISINKHIYSIPIGKTDKINISNLVD